VPVAVVDLLKWSMSTIARAIRTWSRTGVDSVLAVVE